MIGFVLFFCVLSVGATREGQNGYCLFCQRVVLAPQKIGYKSV